MLRFFYFQKMDDTLLARRQENSRKTPIGSVCLFFLPDDHCMAHDGCLLSSFRLVPPPTTAVHTIVGGGGVRTRRGGTESLCTINRHWARRLCACAGSAQHWLVELLIRGTLYVYLQHQLYFFISYTKVAYSLLQQCVALLSAELNRAKRVSLTMKQMSPCGSSQSSSTSRSAGEAAEGVSGSFLDRTILLKQNRCFVCREVFDETELQACQCFHAKGGAKGFGMILCQDCEDDDDLNYCGGECDDRLCFRSCDYTRCDECTQVYCKNCVEENKGVELSACGSCDRVYCHDCNKSSGSDALTTTCDFCKKESCKACADVMVEKCDFCCDKVVCENCLDPHYDRVDGRCCPECGEGTREDFRREDEQIRRYGADYEKYL